MNRSSPRLVPIVLAIVSLAAVGSSTVASAQTIVPTEWPRPVYPQIAQSARVEGEVEVAVDVRPDGSVAAVEVVRGVPLLNQAAVDAARRARFECRGCVDAVNRYSLYVTFRLLRPEDRAETVAPLLVSPTQGWVTVVTRPSSQLHVHYVNVSVRGPRCLYLWRCESEWGGMRDWHEPVYAARCLWLWRCGWSKQTGPGPVMGGDP